MKGVAITVPPEEVQTIASTVALAEYLESLEKVLDTEEPEVVGSPHA